MKKASLLLILASGALLASCGHHVLTPEEIASWDQAHSSSQPAVSSEEPSVEPTPSSEVISSEDITSEEPTSQEEPSNEEISSEEISSEEITSEAESTEPVSSPYTVTIGTETKELVENSAATLVEWQLGEYMVTGLTLAAGDSIVFAKDGVAIT
jgi:hypothetical protein